MYLLITSSLKNLKFDIEKYLIKDTIYALVDEIKRYNLYDLWDPKSYVYNTPELTEFIENNKNCIIHTEDKHYMIIQANSYQEFIVNDEDLPEFNYKSY